MDYTQNITALRFNRQYLNKKAEIDDYKSLYIDTQPGQNVYWHGFGDPPSITYRANFNDIEYNRCRQKNRELIKGRFQGGNLGWIVSEDIEIFAALSMKFMDKWTSDQTKLFDLIKREGPMNIALMKELTGLLVKQITPALHRLQEAFLIYEDQYDGEWDRAWYIFDEMFPSVNLQRYTRLEALKIVIKRFAYRNVFINADMVKSFYKLPIKDIKLAINQLINENVLLTFEDGFILEDDKEIILNGELSLEKSIFILHRNDFLVKSNEYILKEKFKKDESTILQYILIDGEFKGAVLGKFKYGPYIIEDIVMDLDKNQALVVKEDIIKAVCDLNEQDKNQIQLYCGEEI